MYDKHMTIKRKPKPNTKKLPRLIVLDEYAELRNAAEGIAVTVFGDYSISAGVRYALTFTAAALRRLPAPDNMTNRATEYLIHLCAYGDDHRTREAAARELARRNEVTR